MNFVTSVHNHPPGGQNNKITANRYLEANNLRFYRMTIHHGNNQCEHLASVRDNI